MVRSTIKAAFSAILLLAGVSAQAGGPWTQPQGSGYFKLSEFWIVYDRHFTERGGTDPNVTTGIFQTVLYGEYGVAPRWTALLNAPLLARNYTNNVISATTGEVLIPGDAINSLGDVDLGIKYGLNKPGSTWPMALSLTLGLPTGNPAAGEAGNLQTGDGEFNQILQFDIGRGFRLGKNVNGYTSAYAAFNHRTEGFSEEVRLGLEGGVGLLDSDLWLILRLANWESLRNGTASEAITSTSIFANDQAFTSYTLEAAWYVYKGWGVSAAVGGAFRARIVAAAPSYQVGVFWDLNR
jgi:hypothetical protein